VYFSVNLRAFQRNLLPSAIRMQVADYSETAADFSIRVQGVTTQKMTISVCIPISKPHIYVPGTNHVCKVLSF
jgi:hypothetical protein